MFHPESPVLEFHQKTYNTCCLSSLASAFRSIGYNRAVAALVNHIEESLTPKIDKLRNRIHFANDIMTNITHIKSEQHQR